MQKLPGLIAALTLALAGSQAGCAPLLIASSTPAPTLIVIPSPTPFIPSATPSGPTATLPPMPSEVPSATLSPASSQTSGNPSYFITPGAPSGPYALVNLDPSDALNIRSGPGLSYPVIDSFSAGSTDISRTGSSTLVNGATWVHVLAPGGETGWVDSGYLTEYVTQDTFCADTRVTSLITHLGQALISGNGQRLAGLISPAHGMSVSLWPNGNVIPYLAKDAPWIFTSTYAPDWGTVPGSGKDTLGSFHDVILPKLLGVLTATAPGYTLSCDTVQTGAASYDTSWPGVYANVNFDSLYKAGSPGDENSWQTLLVGVEYVDGQPYVFALIQLDGEP
jgi:hypothetical protein